MPQKPPHKLRFAILATDVVLFTIEDGLLKVLLAPVHRPPHYIHTWGVPGGLIKPAETADKAAMRILREKARVRSNVYLEQLYTFSDVKRDPRGRVVSVAYFGLVSSGTLRQEDRREDSARWCAIGELSALAFDHTEMIRVAIKRLRSKLEYTNIVYGLLPREFTMSELQYTYEIILGRPLDKRNFRRKLLELKLVQKAGRKRRGGAHRPAELYRFVHRTPKIVAVL